VSGAFCGENARFFLYLLVFIYFCLVLVFFFLLWFNQLESTVCTVVLWLHGHILFMTETRVEKAAGYLQEDGIVAWPEHDPIDPAHMAYALRVRFWPTHQSDIPHAGINL